MVPVIQAHLFLLEVIARDFFRQIFSHNCLGLSMSAGGLFFFSLIVADYILHAWGLYHLLTKPTI